MLSQTLEKKILRLAYASLDLVTAKYRHFSFITQRNRIICYGYNKVFRSHPLAQQFKHRFADVHSELAAILTFPYRLRELAEFDFINLRIRRDNDKPGFSRPCKCCKNMLHFFGVENIYYSTDEGWSYERIY